MGGGDFQCTLYEQPYIIKNHDFVTLIRDVMHGQSSFMAMQTDRDQGIPVLLHQFVAPANAIRSKAHTRTAISPLPN
jgi:hypothetical protein